jgi:hypothetical protein
MKLRLTSYATPSGHPWPVLSIASLDCVSPADAKDPTVQAQKIDPTLLITHRFKLDQILDAYETFGQVARTRALKVIIEA